MLGEIDGLMLADMDPDQAPPASGPTIDKPSQDGPLQTSPASGSFRGCPEQPLPPVREQVWAIDIALNVNRGHLLAALLFAGTLAAAAAAMSGNRQ